MDKDSQKLLPLMLLFRTPRLMLSASENLASLLLPVCSFFKGSGSRGPMNVGRHVTLSGSGFRFSPINVGLAKVLAFSSRSCQEKSIFLESYYSDLSKTVMGRPQATRQIDHGN
ncbi:hypothetical protein Bca52824_082938 [Brassica carinata]|uniref:Uncharacterized protein n=1 Tax=Brassica carinata TaxID=52824 RepID=A0A8X7PKS6_BRACI|nr:hypothetical protein Bca52824_082938 [Brassica carinata]